MKSSDSYERDALEPTRFFPLATLIYEGLVSGVLTKVMVWVANVGIDPR